MMTKPSINKCDADRQQMSEPTKYIVRCCELRKRREARFSSASDVAASLRLDHAFLCRKGQPKTAQRFQRWDHAIFSSLTPIDGPRNAKRSSPVGN